MHELDLIRAFRADVPGPDAAAIARARRAWQRPARARRTPRLAAGLVAAAAVAAVAFALVATQTGRFGADSAKAAATLRHAADRIRGLPRPLEPG